MWEWIRSLFSRNKIYLADIEPKDSFIQKTSPEIYGSSNYLISFHEFRQLIPNLLLKFPFCAIGFTEEHIKLLWQATSHDSREAYQAKDALRWSHNEATIDVARQLRFNYEMLRRAQEDGCLKAKIGARKSCSCMEGLTDRSILVDDALAAFEGRSSASPIVPPPELPCCFNQGSQTPCDCYVLGFAEWTLGDVGHPPVGSLGIEKRGYEIFHELKYFVEKTPVPDSINPNWKNILLNGAAKLIGENLKEAIAYRDSLNPMIGQGSDEISEKQKEEIEEASSDIESLTAQMRNIWDRMQYHQD